MSPNWLGHIQRQAPRRSALTCRRRCSRLASEKAGIHPPLLGGGHPPLVLQQIPDLEHGFHTPAPLGKS
jgi:hypothetical protein